MNQWKNLNELSSFQELTQADKVNLAGAMSGENGAKRVA